MQLDNNKIKELRRIGHDLKPIILVSENGLSEGLIAEIERALSDHELIKIKMNVMDRTARKTLESDICAAAGCTLVQQIGKTLLVYKDNPKPNKKLSNLHRFFHN